MVKKMLRNNIRTKTAISFISIALLSIVVFSITVNILIINNFGIYLKQSSDNEFNNIASSIAEVYKETGDWNETGNRIAHNLMMSGYGIKVRDLKGNTVIKISSMFTMMGIENSGKTTTKTLPIMVNGRKAAYVDITYSGTMPMNKLDYKFLYDMNKYIAIITIVTIIIVLIISIYISKYLTKPILNIAHVASKLENGNYDVRVKEIPREEELLTLTAAINHLGASLKNQGMLRAQMTQNIAHELRTPLSTLKSHLEAIIDGVWEPSKERMVSLYEEVVRLSNLINDIELLNKIEIDNLKINKVRFNLSDLIKSLLINYESIFINKNQHLEKNIEDGISIFADKDKISEVVINLLANANKYTGEGGNIKVKLYKEGKYAVLSVSDDGIGIPKEDLPFIYERFYRSEKSRNREYGGSGLGLSITKAIIKAHNGMINAESILNEGTKFTVKLPLYQQTS
ncbi:signal transduction histidine kinase [Thermoanaerobacterium thermosaccharolyticum M0795]|uniref:histidine kinase n=2 Tax=Thermoanaerobacterium thermosaccharolyticum TaxID=1517 RepID=D9TPV3_THETC|nr:integral membrane sensor signal transduction histidine kinase [Thermoanaerobacterium thermosaccharolyticum DSM 571]AGB19252.1 signal transduction histidine kinase [Thermoanaerobacterium thermosaccharolyticum M0795]